MLMGASLNPIKIADPGAVKAPGNIGELVSQLNHRNPVFQRWAPVYRKDHARIRLGAAAAVIVAQLLDRAVFSQASL
jgi:hypothetical protein